MTDRLLHKTIKKRNKATYNRQNTALRGNASLRAPSIELFERLRRVGGYRDFVSDVDHIQAGMNGALLGLSRTVFAADGGEIEDVELAALGDPAGAEGWVGLGQGDGGACGEGEDGSVEMHGGWDLVD